ncbi:MAG: NTP transferase domain-containing protein [Rhodospirillales bacterium]|nr:NTP transferase domain-containing protein [Rhodospirillales bacterium]
MKALMLAAGLGRRLFGDENTELPKALLKFGGQTLIERHIQCLLDCGIDELTLIVGHRSEDLLAEVSRVAPAGFVRSTYNPRYRQGPKHSLAMGEDVLRGGDDVLFMDADVLYHPGLLQTLVGAAPANCFVIDRVFQSTDDFVKVCINDGLIVDFGKSLGDGYDIVGEWPGFLKIAPDVANRVADSVLGFIARGEDEGAYEDAFCEVMKTSPAGTFGYEDITGTPWVELDYNSDLEKAATKIMPLIDGLRD